VGPFFHLIEELAGQDESFYPLMPPADQLSATSAIHFRGSETFVYFIQTSTFGVTSTNCPKASSASSQADKVWISTASVRTGRQLPPAECPFINTLDGQTIF